MCVKGNRCFREERKQEKDDKKLFQKASNKKTRNLQEKLLKKSSSPLWEDVEPVVGQIMRNVRSDSGGMMATSEVCVSSQNRSTKPDRETTCLESSRRRARACKRDKKKTQKVGLS